jgi:citrate synthase
MSDQAFFLLLFACSFVCGWMAHGARDRRRAAARARRFNSLFLDR